MPLLQASRGYGARQATPDLTALIQVKPGLPDGTQFVFQREGNQTPATEPGPVVFVLRSEKHPRFSRHGADLLHTATIPLNEALTGTSLPVMMLDGRWGSTLMWLY